jgi:hypothetical protein
MDDRCALVPIRLHSGDSMLDCARGCLCAHDSPSRDDLFEVHRLDRGPCCGDYVRLRLDAVFADARRVADEETVDILPNARFNLRSLRAIAAVGELHVSKIDSLSGRSELSREL